MVPPHGILDVLDAVIQQAAMSDRASERIMQRMPAFLASRAVRFKTAMDQVFWYRVAAMASSIGFPIPLIGTVLQASILRNMGQNLLSLYQEKAYLRSGPQARKALDAEVYRYTLPYLTSHMTIIASTTALGLAAITPPFPVLVGAISSVFVANRQVEAFALQVFNAQENLLENQMPDIAAAVLPKILHLPFPIEETDLQGVSTRPRVVLG